MTTQSVPAPAPLTREAPSLGGFNVTVLRLEIRRLLRNRRTVIFAGGAVWRFRKDTARV